LREAHKEAGEYVLSLKWIWEEATVGKKQSEESWVWHASYAAAEKTEIFMALRISEGGKSLDHAGKQPFK
jgi:hypothetical protein